MPAFYIESGVGGCGGRLMSSGYAFLTSLDRELSLDMMVSYFSTESFFYEDPGRFLINLPADGLDAESWHGVNINDYGFSLD